jgi:hypothetical protein
MVQTWVVATSNGPDFEGVLSKLEGCGTCATPEKAGKEDGEALEGVRS